MGADRGWQATQPIAGQCRAGRGGRRISHQIPLDGQPALADALGEGLDAAVVLVAAAIEHGALDAGGLGALGEQLAGLRGLLQRLEALEIGLGVGDGGQRVAALVVDELGEDAPVGPEDADARARGGPDDLRAHAAAALEALRRLREDRHARFPTFRATYSPSYRMPLPL